MGWFRLRSCSLKMMKFFDIHTHSPAPDAIRSCTVKDVLSPEDKGYRSVGIHPWYLDDADKQLQWLEQAVHEAGVLAVGECGLDKLVAWPMEHQKAIFEECVSLSERMHLPLVIHAVRCTELLIEIKRLMKPEMPWVIHGFRGKGTLAAEYLKHGFYLSFGINYQADALCRVPIERLFLETDDSGAAIREVYEQAAQTRGISPEELAVDIGKNVQEVFFRR